MDADHTTPSYYLFCKPTPFRFLY